MKISVAIPTYEMNGKGVEALEHSFKILQKQTLKDFEVVISDHSRNDAIEELCKYYSDNFLNIIYYRNKEKRGNPASNTNEAISLSSGEFIKILCQDDYLYSEDSLELTYKAIKDSGRYWLASMYVHSNDRINHYRNYLPRMNPNIELVNTIGTPSCITIEGTFWDKFDENLSYYYDCEWYKRVFENNGSPYILFTPTMVNYIHTNQVTKGISEELERSEIEYIKRKYS